jgi:hypothetical protein
MKSLYHDIRDFTSGPEEGIVQGSEEKSEGRIKISEGKKRRQRVRYTGAEGVLAIASLEIVYFLEAADCGGADPPGF